MRKRFIKLCCWCLCLEMEPDFQLKEKMVFKSLIFLYVNFVGSFGQYFKLLIKFKRLVFFIKRLLPFWRKNYFNDDSLFKKISTSKFRGGLKSSDKSFSLVWKSFLDSEHYSCFISSFCFFKYQRQKLYIFL